MTPLLMAVGMLFALLSAIPALYLILNVRLSRTPRSGTTRRAASPEAITIVIPVFHQDPGIFGECIASVASQGTPFLVVGDGSLEPYRSITEGHGGKFLFLRERGGKKRALAEGIAQVKTPLVLFLDSDTVLPPQGAVGLASYFIGNVGGVAANLRVRDTGTVTSAAAEFVERAREVVFRAMSPRGSVLDMDGACAAYRTALVRPYIDSPEFQALRVLGHTSRLGDDWQLNDFVLRQGFRTVKAFDVVAATYPPTTLRGYVAQNIRWSRSHWIRLGSYLKQGLPPATGTLYALEAGATYFLPLAALFSLLLRARLVLRALIPFPAGVSHALLLATGLAFMTGGPPGYGDLRFSLLLLGVLAGALFLLAVSRLQGRSEPKFLASGVLGTGVLFVSSIYGLLTFWREPAWPSRDASSDPGGSGRDWARHPGNQARSPPSSLGGISFELEAAGPRPADD